MAVKRTKIVDRVLETDHLIARHGFNDDTVSIWSTSELVHQHDRYHADETAEYLDHVHRVEPVAFERVTSS